MGKNRDFFSKITTFTTTFTFTWALVLKSSKHHILQTETHGSAITRNWHLISEEQFKGKNIGKTGRNFIQNSLSSLPLSHSIGLWFKPCPNIISFNLKHMDQQ
jgi:hypothetical protein